MCAVRHFELYAHRFNALLLKLSSRFLGRSDGARRQKHRYSLLAQLSGYLISDSLACPCDQCNFIVHYNFLLIIVYEADSSLNLT
ncbi:hypothetical protein D3C71_1882730 [compost metagenome]